MNTYYAKIILKEDLMKIGTIEFSTHEYRTYGTMIEIARVINKVIKQHKNICCIEVVYI